MHWVCFGPPLAEPHKSKRLAIGDPRANYLYFVRDDKHTRIYKIPRGERAPLEPQVLAEWLKLAGVPAKPWEPPSGTGLLGG